MATETPRYAAFISYRHMPRDRAWALRIMRALETYRPPKPLLREAFPDRLGHLFRDEDEIPASSDLSDQIKDALAHSDYLIVVCSPDTPGSRWVSREIELFQDMGKGDRIIPLLIAGEPDESFPPELRRRRVVHPRPDGTSETVWEEVEPIAADLRPRTDERESRTERRAVLRLAAALLGCRYDDLARRDDERRRAALRNRLATAAGLLLVAATGGGWWWNANLRVKTEYCANYGERWAVPFCVGPLDARTQAQRTTSYRFRVQGGRVLELARVNGAGTLVGHQDTMYEDEPWTKGVALWRFSYRSDAMNGRPLLDSVEEEGPTGARRREVGNVFSADRRPAVARFDRGLGVAARLTAAGSALGPVASIAGVFRRHSSIGQYRLKFDATTGLLRRLHFEPVGGGSTIADALGAYGRAYAYGSQGLPTRICNLDARGQTLVEKNDIACVDHTYDRRGDLSSVAWRGAAGRPQPDGRQFARVIFVRNSVGNVAREDYEAANGALVNRLVERADSSMASADSGIARLAMRYDNYGNEREKAYFGINGKPVLRKDIGAASIKMSYVARGYEREEAYFGIDGKPVLRKDIGVASIKMSYGRRGNETERAYFGIDGKPVLRREIGVASIKMSYGARRNEREEAYFGIDGKPVLRKDIGAASIKMRYGTRGNEREAACFGIDGKPVLDKDQGVARVTWRYGTRGNEREEAYFGIDGKPALRKDIGAASIRMSYGTRGNEVERAYFGIDGKPVLRKDTGAPPMTLRFEARGNKLAQAD